MSKEKWLKQYGHLLDKEGAFLKSIEKIIQTQKYYETTETQFCSPDIAFGIREILESISDINYLAFGGYESAERIRFRMAPEYETVEITDMEIAALKFKFPSKFHSVAHPDVLGALMGPGIQRERTGDILIDESSFVIFVEADLSDYVLMNLTQVGRAPVKGERVSAEEIKEIKRPVELISDTVKSLRLDAVIAAFHNLSRSEAQSLVSSDKVKVNYRPVSGNAYEVKPGDMISVRGHGRFTIHAIEGMTKKDRIRVVFSVVK